MIHISLKKLPAITYMALATSITTFGCAAPANEQAAVPVPVTTEASVNLLTNPSFEQPLTGDTPDKSLPGWEVQFRGSAEAPSLSNEEFAVIDDPAQAHSGRKFLRIQAKKREIVLRAPRPQVIDAGLYEVSVWARGRAGTLVGAGVSYPPAGFGAGLPGLSGEWKKYSVVTYSPAVEVTKLPWPDQAQFFIALFAPGERGQTAEPQLDIDDVSVTRLTTGLADTFGDHMVLQRDRLVPVWGWAKNPGQKLTVKFNGQTQSAQSDKNGRWQVTLQPMKAGGPYVIELDGRAVAYDVMVGDVWVCSGQSNMEMGVDKLNGIFGTAPEVTSKADHPQIRLWQASKQFSETPLGSYQQQQHSPHDKYQAIWNICTPETIRRGVWGGFSAVGYFFGREIQETQKVPVGLMMIANGGTQIESFISPEALKAIPAEQWTVPPITAETRANLKLASLPKPPDGADTPTPAYAAMVARVTDPNAQGGVDPKAFQLASSVYNSLMAPVFPMAVRGVLWYQGEHNAGDVHYASKLKTLISDWRTRFGQKDLPFIITQLPNWRGPDGGGFMIAREAQLQVSQTVPNTALAVAIDLADKEGDGYGASEIHPKNKQDVGHRNALAARALVYKENIVASGPIYRSMKIENGKIRLTFDSIGKGLAAKGEKLVGFSIAGDDRKFVPAEAVIDGQTVIVSAAQVANPVAVRYSYAQFVNPLGTLTNSEGLPASPFRTDSWPVG